MAGFLVVAAAAAGWMIGAPAPSPPAELSPAVAKCISDNASKVEQAVPSLPEAVSFLTDDVCAVPISQEQARQSEDAMHEQRDKQHALCLAQKDKPKSDSELSIDPCTVDQAYASMDLQGGSWMLMGASANRAPEITAYAARLLLDLRLAHAKP